MGDRQASGLPNGRLSEENPSTAKPNASAIASNRWNRAEVRTLEIICRIQPTVVSEMRRKAVVDYMQRLLRGRLRAEVFPFGSVPLKTYLPDGDIDLSAFSPSHVEDILANEVRTALEGEEQIKDSEFEVRDVQYIHAEVKLVKCLVQNIVVDISFNQLGGLCTLCFLEQVDRLIGKEHLFKRSIILIKAWCYYESRILGAHHGLISTYALETLVLYIFHHFHSSLDGPLEVLYRFLDYFSKFDWDNYCVSLNGPVPLSSLPEMTGETPEIDGADLLLSKEFLKTCVETYSVPAKLSESSRPFPLKHLNIVDPLKENNNLGRSVSRGNFYRIRSAFTYGARKLGRILSSEEDISEELNKFFMNTLDRHGSGQRPDVQYPSPNFLEASSFGASALGAASNLNPDGYMEDQGFSRTVSVETRSVSAEQVSDSCNTLCEDTARLKIQDQEGDSGAKLQRGPKYFNVQSLSQNSYKMSYNSMMSERDASIAGTIISGSRLVGDIKDPASSRIMVSNSRKEIDVGSMNESCTSSSGRIPEVPRRFSRSNTYPGKVAAAHVDQSGGAAPFNIFKKVPSWQQTSNEQVSVFLERTQKSVSVMGDAPQSCRTNENSYVFLLPDLGSYPVNDLGQMGQTEAISSGMVTSAGSTDIEAGHRIGAAGNYEDVNHLSDLIGDFDSHIQSLACGRSCYESTFFGPVLPFPAVSSSYVHNRQTYEGIHRPSQSNHMIPYIHANGGMPGPPFSLAGSYYPMNSPIISGGFNIEDLPKPRGTGTYFPNMNQRMYKERQAPGRGRQHVMPNHMSPRPRNNGRVAMSTLDINLSAQQGIDTSLQERGSNEPPRQETSKSSYPASTAPNVTGWPKLGTPAMEPVYPLGSGRGKLAMTEVPSSRPIMRYPHSTNGLPPSTEGLEFGTLGSLPWSSLQREQSRKLEQSSVHAAASGDVLPMLSGQRSVVGVSQEKAPQSYHLKDEDFPPLSV